MLLCDMIEPAGVLKMELGDNLYEGRHEEDAASICGLT